MTTGLAEGVLAVARRLPSSLSVVDGDRSYDYRALDTASGAVAGALRGHGVRPGDAVAVCLPRSWRLVVTLLGIRRLGATAVPLDAQSPPGRRRHILADSGSVALVDDGPPAVPVAGVRPLAAADLMRGTSGEAATGEAASETSGVGGDAPVSVLFYTSGTTGQPKGVEVRDAGLVRLAQPGYIRLAEGARYACLSNPAFDALSFELWAPLLTGGCCVILDEETVATPAALAEALRRERIDTMFVTSALFNAVADVTPGCFSSAGQVLIGGEQLNARMIRRWYARNPASATQLYNVYGPTEATTFALIHPIPRDFDAEVVPIGRPLPGTQTLPVADGGRLAGPGELAELYIGGDAVAAGYRNLTAESDRRFVRLPWHDGGARRYYRTGDLVRPDADGVLVYAGRTDRQVKIRGFRVEPEEVERQLVTHPAIRQAYACTRHDRADGPPELLAYLVTDADLSYGDFSYADFERHLGDVLPPYMRPHRLYRVDALPRTANGKVDQDALLARDDPPWRPGDGGASPTSWQHEVLGLVGEVLRVTDPRPGDTFIAAGGDSLAALRLRFEIRERWGCDLPQAVVLRSDLAGLAREIAAARPGRELPYPEVAALTAPAGPRSAAATSEQQRLWLLQQQDPESCAYHVSLAFRLTGPVDAAALRTALGQLTERHPALRTAFEPSPGGLRQRVGDPYDPWAEADPVDPAGGGARRLFATPFDLSRPELLRACWQPADDGGTLLLHLHHIAVDGRSLTVLFEELSARYAGEAVPEVAPTPLEYAAWQADWFGRPAYRTLRAALRAHYTAVLETAEPLRPLRPARTEGPATGASRLPAAGRLLVVPLGAPLRAALGPLGAQLGLTRFELLLGVFSWSVYGVTGRTRPRVASPVVNRPVREFESSVGMFANTVLIPLQVMPGEPLRAQLRRQAADIRAVLDRQDVSLADVLEDHDFRTGGPLFDFMFVLDNTELTALRLPGCEVRPVWLEPPGTKCPLTLTVVEHGDGLDCLWEYAGDYFGAAEVQAMAELFRTGLDGLGGLADGPDPTLDDLVAPYRDGLPDLGRGAEQPLEYTTVADGFARQVRRTPDALALADGGRTVTYAQLDAYAATLAGELRTRFTLPSEGQPCHVALRLDPSVEHVTALLALARLNLTAIPLDPAYPPALLRHILDQVVPVCVLVPPVGPPDGQRIPHHPVVLPAAPVTPPVTAVPARAGRRPLYTLFTSGSTGTPKGVQVPDLTLCNLLQWQATTGGLPPDAVTQQFSMLSFDVSFQEIFGTLCGGGTLHLLRTGWRHDLPALLHQLDVAGIERIHMPYVALQLLAEHGCRLGRYPSRLRDVVTAGEQLLCTDAVRGWFSGLAGARLFNHYGPTETHVVSGLCLDGDPAGWPDRPAIGAPVAGAWLRVVDERDRPVPPDCPGDLLIGGLPAVPCYLGDPDLTASRFVELTGGDGPDGADGSDGSGRFYRSGDRARFDRQGQLHYLGRHDEQVKVSGHRLELGQVEAALATHPAVGAAAVVLDAGRLVACVQFRGAIPTAEELAAHLAARLPAYVRVNRFRRVTELPLTASGKLDRRRALSAPGEELGPQPAAAVSLTEREAQLTALFQAVIGRPITPGQRFFDAGASSLGLMRFHLRATSELGLSLSIPDLFEHVTIRDLARFLDAGPATRPALDSSAPDSSGLDSSGARAEPIAIIGMAVRLPGADDLAAFWAMVTAARSGITYFDADDGLVGARSQMSGLLAFDPGHFGIGPAQARLMDPQQRHLLMACVQALAHAGLDPKADPASHPVGLVASCGENTYFQAMLLDGDPGQRPDDFQLALHHDKDFLATKVAYHLGLTGPAFSVQAACASSLVAVHVAAGLLRQGDAEVMLAGGVLVDTLLTGGYRYRPQHIFAPDGHCRPFSDDASGTVGASGVGVVVLKPLRLARRDGDTVYAMITGSAVNNDGAAKLSYTAPGLAGQREVVRTALRRSGRTAADLGYVEAHGTGTELGDPVEVSALRQAYGPAQGAGPIALASVKSQIGHLGAAAGVAGLVRAALAVHHGQLPPNVDFRRLSPRIGQTAPLSISAAARPWPAGRPRVAAVSSFGIGGTNAHVVLESGEPGLAPAATVPLLMISASSAVALEADAARIAGYLQAHPDSYPHVLRHLQAGRALHHIRAAAVCPDATAAVRWLRTATPVVVTPAGPERTIAVDHAQTEAGDAAMTRAGAGDLAAAWLDGAAISWPAGPAQAPWDFPPPAFALADYDFTRAAPARTTPAQVTLGESPTRPQETRWPARRPEPDWLYQPQWNRLRRAAASPRYASSPSSGFGFAVGSGSSAVLVIMTAGETDPAVWRPFQERYARVVRVAASVTFGHVGGDAYRVDPADPASLSQLLDSVTGPGVGSVDWLHALPLAVDGPVGADTIARARWAGLDTPAALLQAVAGRMAGPALRTWWMTHRAQPVDGPVDRPELGLLAGITVVGPQECAIEGHWLDLPSPDPAQWAGPVASLIDPAAPVPPLPRRLALRHQFWWQQVPVPLPPPVPSWPPVPGTPPASGTPGGPGVHLVLGGTGGIGTAIAAWLLAESDGQVVLVARWPRLPPGLTRWADRVQMIRGDLAAEPAELIADRIAATADRIDTVVHAAGVGTGGLILRRDAAAAAAGALATAVKLNGALLVEQLVARYRPAVALYCSSMSAQLGGVGQLDYAAANGALDGFAHYRSDDDQTTRIGIDWDIWREAGLARDALRGNAGHQAHLAVGLSLEEARRVLDRSLRLQLPQILVSTTDIERSAVFYAPLPPAPDPAVPGPAAGPGGTPPPTMSTAAHLAGCLRRWLELDDFDAAASLYDLGADSLTLLDLIAEVKEHTGADLALSQLSHRVSLAEVLALLGGAEMTEPPAVDPVTVEVWQEGTGPAVLCLVHPVGGDIPAYRPLVSALDDRLTVCLIADPVLHQPELAGWPIAERGRRYHAALQARFPNGPWHWRLAGWSFGAWVAVAMAAEAEAAGRPAEEVYLLDPPSPDAGPRLAAYDEAQLSLIFARELAEGAGADGAGPERLGPQGQAYAERLAHCGRANLASMAAYMPPRLAATPARMWLAGRATPGLPAPEPPEGQTQRWRTRLPGLAGWQALDTTHDGVVRPPHVQAIADAISAASLPVLTVG